MYLIYLYLTLAPAIFFYTSKRTELKKNYQYVYMHKINVIRTFQEYVMIIERGRRWNMATRVTETVPFCRLRVLQVMLWNSILFHLGMQCHPQPGVYSGRWLHHRTEDPAVPQECRGATELGRTESPHCTSSAGEAGSEGQGHYWRGMSLDVLWNHSY